jgi:CIC family chloride channel protein
VFVLKAVASIVSLGAGFRGGLFFASLFLGALMGKMVTAVAAVMGVQALADPVTSAVVGMSAMAVAIVGGPLTMTFLALEMTGDFVITGIVLAAAVVASMMVRELFGYSFTTWRLHLRGETIRSAQDVGLIRSLTVGKLMQGNVVTAPVEMTLAQFRRQFPLGSIQRVVMVEDEDRYAGMVFLADVYGPAKEILDGELEIFIKHPEAMLTPAMNVKAALEGFDRHETDALVVVEDTHLRRVLGLVTEGYALKRYAAELDKTRRTLAGEKV